MNHAEVPPRWRRSSVGESPDVADAVGAVLAAAAAAASAGREAEPPIAAAQRRQQRADRGDWLALGGDAPAEATAPQKLHSDGARNAAALLNRVAAAAALALSPGRDASGVGVDAKAGPRPLGYDTAVGAATGSRVGAGVAGARRQLRGLWRKLLMSPPSAAGGQDELDSEPDRRQPPPPPPLRRAAPPGAQPDDRWHRGDDQSAAGAL
jgi:hypothetical protein